MNTPMLLLMFNRPDLVELNLANLSKIKPKKLYVSCDGPRANSESDLQNIRKCIQLCDRGITWECDVKYNLSDSNLGCRLGVTSGIKWFFEHEPFGLIIEDDCLINSSFCEFATQMLATYFDDPSIFMIAADGRATGHLKSSQKYTITDFPMLWGWATWSHKWKKFDVEYKNFDNESAALQSRLKDLKLKNSTLYSNICDTIHGSIDTWDYQLCGQFLTNGWKCIVPSKNLVSNKGFGESASHTVNEYDLNSNLKAHSLLQPYEKDFTKNTIKKTNDWYVKNELSRSLLNRVRRRLRLISYFSISSVKNYSRN